MSKKIIVIATAALVGVASPSQAGNPERMGQAGASQLLVNPFTRNMGQAGANSARVRGIEAQFLNIAGTAFTKKTEILFNRTTWLSGTDIYINALGVSQRVGETGTIGFGVVSIDGGKIPITTVESPDGGLGNFNPTFLNIGLSYAKMFSDNIYGGINAKLVTEQIPNASASGLALDAGIQYHAGKYDQIHFGIALRNWGPKMFFEGDGLSRQVTVNSVNNEYELTVNNRSASFELPALVNIGAAYDFYLTKDSAGVSKDHRLSVSGNFTSHSFTYDNGLFGVEYAWKEMLMVRSGLLVENGIFMGEGFRRTSLAAPSFGFTFEVPFNEKKSTIGVDYAYRMSSVFFGTHSFGIRLNL